MANLPKYAVHSKGATKPPAPVSPRTASLKQKLVLCLALACLYTVLLFCVAIAARTPISSMRVAPEIQSWGEGPTLRESPYRVSCTFEALAKQNKKSFCPRQFKVQRCV